MESTEQNTDLTKGMQTKKKIYETAVKIFEKNGVDGTRVSDIVREAGVSKGDFYIYYKSKFSLIEEYVKALDVNYEEYFKSIPQNTPASVMIRMITEKTARVLVEDIGYHIIRSCYEGMLSNKIEPQMVLSYTRSLPHIYKSIVLKGICEGEFKATADAESFSRHLLIGIRGMTFEWCVCSCEFDLEQELNDLIEWQMEKIKG